MGKYKKKRKKNSFKIELPFFIGLIAYITSKSIATFILTSLITTLIMVAYSLYKKHQRNKKYLDSGIEIVDKLTGEEFEQFLLSHFQNLGYSGSTTSTTNDYGADLVLKKDGFIIVIQAKRWTSKVGISAIQEVIGAKSYYNADKCLVVCNNYFTPNAINLAKASDVELWDRIKLLDIMFKANGKEILESYFDIGTIDDRNLCKKCGVQMLLKSGRYGNFYGCSNYPKCRYTEEYK